MDEASYLNHSTMLSAEVEPFIPRSDVGNAMAEHMLSHQMPGPLPHYLTSCYPFVQDNNGTSSNHGSNGYDYYGRDARGWPPGVSGSNNQYPPHPIAPPSRYHAPSGADVHPPMTHTAPMYAYHPGPMNMQYPGLSPSQYQSQFGSSGQHYGSRSSHGRRDASRKSNDRKQSSNKKGQRSVGIQMEVKKVETADDDHREMVDYCQQTDFPNDIASKTLVEKPSPLRKITRTGRKWRRANTSLDQSASCDSSDNNGDEADVDSDSGYYSPKHQISRRYHQPAPPGVGIAHEDRNEIGTSVHSNYQGQDQSPQRVVYLPQPASAYYQVPPNQYLGAPQAPVIRLPTSGTPPMIMTPPPVMNLGHAGHQQAMALANFKSRSAWEQEILKTYNVAPICPPAFGPRHRAYGPGRGRGQHNWRYPRFPGPRFPTKPQGRHSQGTSPGLLMEHIPGMIRLSGTAPQPLIHQIPPQLTDEDFPGLQAAGASGTSAHQHATFSYSAALQNKPKPASDIELSEDSPIKSLIEPDDSGSGKGSRRRRKKTERAAKAAAEEYAEISKEQENLKKQLTKSGNRSKTPQFNLAEMLSKLEETQVAGDDRNQHGAHRQLRPGHPSGFQYVAPHNPLDSSAPLKKRGKEREIPKIKKPSALKKVILKEREEKKNSRYTSLTSNETPEYDIPSVPTDYFKPEDSTEINLSDTVTTPEVNSSENPSPLTVSVSGNSSPIVPANLPKIHSRRYREYCSGQVLDKQIDEECIVTLQKLVQFQERMYQRDPIKAKAKRRFVLGIREVTKHLKLKKLCCVLISPNLEKIQSKGGLDDALQQIIQLCKTQSVPYVFALGRCAMGRAVSKLVPVSIIGIFDYSGVEESYKKMLDLVKDAQNKYHEMMLLYQQEITEANTIPPTVPPAPTKRFAHMGHSRNPSAASCVSFCSMISEPISEMNPSEGTSWRKMMDVTDEQNPAPALSPPPETAQEEDPENETGEEEKKLDSEQEDYEDAPSDNEDSFLNVADTSGSHTSEERQNTDFQPEKSFSTVSTIVARSSEKSRSKHSAGTASEPVTISSIIEETPSDPAARINSWLASSVQNLEVGDSPHHEEKLEKNEAVNPDPANDDDDDFASTHEDNVDQP